MPTPKSFALWRILHDCEQSFAANLRTVIAYDRLFSHPVFSWARNRRNGVRFPKHPRNVSRSFRCSGPTFHFWARLLTSCSWVRFRRNRVHFPNHTHIVFNDACVGLVQWSISNREDSHPVLKKSLKLLLQTLRVVESYPFTKFDKIPLINFADFSSL